MSTDVDRWERHQAAKAVLHGTAGNAAAVLVDRPSPSSAVLSIADWARELDAAYEIAQRLVLTPFAPKHFQGKPADAAAAILTGHELGLTPMASLRSIFMIQGTPGLYAKVMVAVAQSRGHSVWVAEQSDDRVVVKGRRRGEAEVYETTWTPERCKLAGLDSNTKYRTSRQQMMVARGQAEIARQVAADALHGVPYSVEELEDLPPVRAEARVTGRDLLADPEPISHVATSSAQPRSNPEPWAPSGEPDHPVDIGDAPEAMTQAQSRNLYRLLRATQREAKDDALRYLTLLFDREVTSTKELSKVEARIAIDDLEAQLAIAAEVDGEGGEQEALL